MAVHARAALTLHLVQPWQQPTRQQPTRVQGSRRAVPASSRILPTQLEEPDDHTVTDRKHACPCLRWGAEFALAQLEQKLMDACESVAVASKRELCPSEGCGGQ